MNHNAIIKEIYESNKDKFKSEEQIKLILNSIFCTLTTCVFRGYSVHFRGLFYIKWSYESKNKLYEKLNKVRDENYKKNKNRRAWVRKIIDFDFM